MKTQEEHTTYLSVEKIEGLRTKMTKKDTQKKRKYYKVSEVPRNNRVTRTLAGTENKAIRK